MTLWFTLFMVLLAAVLFTFIAVYSSSTFARELRGALMSLVEKNSRELEYDDGELEIDDDFVFFKNGIHCLLFTEDGVKIGGSAPAAALEQESLQDGAVRSLHVGAETYLLYDRPVLLKKGKRLWIRGAVPEGGGTVNAAAIYRAALIAVPLLILLASGGGYLIAGRSLHPIKKIGRTAEEIRQSGDLSKRIGMAGKGDELHQLAETFNRMFDRVEANFETQKHFTSDASHELRTPLSTILAQCEYALENVTEKVELYELIGAIQKQGYRMSHLIETLLSFTRMEQRTEGCSFERIDLSALVLSVCREQQDSGEKGIVLSEEIEPGIELQADGALITRMLENLISNAYRYGREQGRIRVALERGGDDIRLTVADDGVGMAEEEIPKIWERLYQINRSRSPARGRGLGLGLAMVKQIVELHGGRVNVKSEPGWGTVFTVVFDAPP